MKPGGSRELPSVWVLYKFVKSIYLANRIAVQKIAPGRSREPPVATRFGRTNDRNDDMGHRTQAKAAPLHGSDRIGLASEAALHGLNRKPVHGSTLCTILT